MNAPMPLSPAERELWINARSLILKAIDLMDRRYCVGKYKQAVPVPHSPTETIATAVQVTHEDNGNHPSV